MSGVNDTSSDHPQEPRESDSETPLGTPAPVDGGDQDPGEAAAGGFGRPSDDEQPSGTEGPGAVDQDPGAEQAGTAQADEDETEIDEDAPVPAEFFRISNERSRHAAVDAARRELARHEVVVMPTDTVYGIAANAFSPSAVQRLLEAKGRDRTMPPPVLIAHTGVMDGLADAVSEETRALAGAFWPGGLTLICHAQPSLQWDLGETRGTVALRVPDDEVAQALLQETGPLAVSSANRTGMPAAVTAQQAQDMLGDSVRVYLEDGPRTEGMDPAASPGSESEQAPAPVASTIVDCTGGVPVVVRHGRISLTRLREVVPSVISRDGAADSAAGDVQDGEQSGAEAEAAAPTHPEDSATGQDRDAAAPEAAQAGARGSGDSAETGDPDDGGGTGREAGRGGSTAADPEIGIVERARAEQDDARPSAEDFAGVGTAGVSAAAAVVAHGGGRRGQEGAAAPDQDRTRPAAPDAEGTRPLGLAQASALVAFSSPDPQEAPVDEPRDTGVDQQR